MKDNNNSENESPKIELNSIEGSDDKTPIIKLDDESGIEPNSSKEESTPSEHSEKDTKKDKKKKKKRSLLFRLFKWIFSLFLTLTLAGAIVGAVLYVYFEKDLPDVYELKTLKPQGELKILSRDGELIAFFGERRRDPLTYDQIPPVVINAVIATEDSRFFEHHGIDPIGIMRALITGIENGGHFSQGGSTITQQVAKNYFLTPEKKLTRKIKEAILAIKIEKTLTKEEILTLYLNMINFGSRAYGIGAASKTFFNKEAKDLTLSQAALLAGLPNAPSAYNPISHPDRALERRNWVLYRMLDQNLITKEEYNAAINEPLGVDYYEPKVDFRAPYIAEMARQYMVDKYGEDAAYNDNFKVYTTITRKDQEAATESLIKHLLAYDQGRGYRGPEAVFWEKDDAPLSAAEIKNKFSFYYCHQGLCPALVTSVKDQEATAQLKTGEVITLTTESLKGLKVRKPTYWMTPKKLTDVLEPGQLIRVKEIVASSDKPSQWALTQLPEIEGAVVSMNSDTGAIESLVGGFDFNRSKFNRATQAIRQIGSTIKPFIYTAALDKGLTLGSVINDTPITRSAGSSLWRPKNSPDRYEGPTLLRVGMAKSKNVMMVRTMRAVGIEYVADYLKHFGFPSENITENESLALGSASFTPLQVARGYSVIVNGGYLVNPYIIDKIEEGDEVVYTHQPKIACEECIANSTYELNPTQIDLENTENEIATSEDEVPDAARLQADENIILPNSGNTAEGSTEQTEESIYAPHVISSEVAFLIKDAMRSVVWGGSGYNGTAWRSKVLQRQDMGGKTGTTNAVKDIWYAGYLGNRVTIVWMGFDDHRLRLYGASGGTTANPVWNDYMLKVKDTIPVKKSIRPQDVIGVSIEKSSGLLAPNGANAITEYFIKGTEPTEYYTPKVGTSIINEDGTTEELF